MDLELFARYSAETNAAKKRALLNRLVTENMPLARKFANKFQTRTLIKVEMDDLVQAAAIGLMEAFPRFNPARAKFSTYAEWWCRHEMQKVTSKTPRIYQPRDTSMPYRVHVKAELIESNQGRPATAEELGVDPEDFEKWRMRPTFVYLDEPIRGGDAMSSSRSNQPSAGAKHERFPDESPNQEESLELLQEERHVHQAMQGLPERSKRLIESHYLKDMTFKEIAGQEHVSVAQARELCLQAVYELQQIVGV